MLFPRLDGALARRTLLKALAAPRWKAFTNRARLPEPAVLKTVIKVVERVNQHW